MFIKCPECGAVQDVTTKPGKSEITCRSCRKLVELEDGVPIGSGVYPSVSGHDSGPVRVVDNQIIYSAPSEESPNLLLGHIISGFRVDSVIGKGPRTYICSGEQVALRRKVILKLLTRKFVADADQIYSFLESSRSSASLIHPHIVQVYDVISAGDLHMIVMERIVGRNLLQAAESGATLTSEAVAQIGIALADALGMAHLRGICHANLHPANVFLSESRIVQISDFGHFFAPQYKKSSTGSSDGRIAFFSPSILSGAEPEALDDIFGLGAILFFILTGKVPQVKGGHQPLNPADTNHQIPYELATIVSAMLSFHPEDRPQTMEDVSSRLSKFMENHRGIQDFLPSDRVRQRANGLRPPTRRMYKRLRESMEVKLSPCEISERDTIMLLSKVENISENGAFVASDSPLPVGSVVRLKFRVSEGDVEVNVLGVVRWINGGEEPGMGVQFLDVSTHDKKGLRRYVSEKAVGDTASFLARTPLHQSILKLVCSNWGKVVTMDILEQLTGASGNLLFNTLPDFESCGLIEVMPRSIRCIRPESNELETALQTAILKG